MKKFDSILNQSKELKDFEVFDVDSEWNLFKERVGGSEQSSTNNNEGVKKTSLSLVFKKSTILIISVAASITLVLGFLLTFKGQEPYRQTVITVDNVEEIKMIDGSKIDLNKNSKLEYPITLKDILKRKVILVGGATFEISRNEKLPFEVYYGDVMVEVLGTVFSVAKENGLTVVQNISGSVAVSQVLNRSNRRILQQGETLLFQNGKFFMPKDTVGTIIEEEDDLEFESDVDQDGKVTFNSKETNSNSKRKGSTFKLDNVVKNYLLKFHKKKIKVERGTKFDKKITVKLDINKTYQEILLDLKKEGHIDFKPGKCEDCFIITSPTKQR